MKKEGERERERDREREREREREALSTKDRFSHDIKVDLIKKKGE